MSRINSRSFFFLVHEPIDVPIRRDDLPLQHLLLVRRVGGGELLVEEHVAGLGDLSRQVVQHHNLAQAKTEAGVSPAFIVGEFNLHRIGRKEFNHGSDLASAQAAVRQIIRQRDNIKELNGRIHLGLHFH